MALNPNTLGPQTAHALGLARAGTYQGPSDVQDHYLWDTLPFPATAQEMKFFVTPQGGNKSFAQTNMIDSGKMPTGQSFVCFAVRPMLVLHAAANALPNDPLVSTPVINDFFRVMENSAVQIQFQNNSYQLQAPGSNWLNNVNFASAATDASNTVYGRVGDYNHKNWLPLHTPIIIGELVAFSLSVFPNPLDAMTTTALAALNTATCQLQWVLKGTLERLK